MENDMKKEQIASDMTEFDNEEGYNIYGSKLKDVKQIEEMKKLISRLYEEIGRMYMATKPILREGKWELLTEEELETIIKLLEENR